MVERLSERNTASPLLWRGEEEEGRGEERRGGGEERKMRRRGERGEEGRREEGRGRE